MTDKVQKIREGVERLKSQLLRGACSSQVAMETICKEEAYNEVLAILDTMQEEPVSIDFEQEFYKAFGQVKDFTLGMQIAKWFYDMGKNSQEPVSEELEEAAMQYAKLKHTDAALQKIVSWDFKAGAKWQKEKDESTTEDLGEYINELSKQFPEVSFAKLSRIAVRVAKWQMAQMIKDATDVTVHVDAGGYPYIPQMELYDYDKDIPLAKEGDKYKVVLINEG